VCMGQKNCYLNIKNILNLGCELEPKLEWVETCSRYHTCFGAERRFEALQKRWPLEAVLAGL
jgi:hypothetical protein